MLQLTITKSKFTKRFTMFPILEITILKIQIFSSHIVLGKLTRNEIFKKLRYLPKAILMSKAL